MKTELLAPAKDKETAFAAIDCGADAIYIGANNFGARKNASNNIEDIVEVVNHAHKFWVKVFITMNTILTDTELSQAVQMVKEFQKIGVDAIIIQDMGLLEKIIELIDSGEKVPPIHISTQCDNYLPEKVKFFNKIGVSRVILARELSIEQIKKIHEENPNLELEAFVHGALCVSMSGQCYLSQHIGGRSANRGECAQPCRKKYTVLNDKNEILAKDIHALCLKDFNASYQLKNLIDAGICSFKIEGRLKDTGYVKNIVSYYRQQLGKGCSSGTSSYPFKPNPQKSFNRGFTEYFLSKREDCFNFESPKSKGEFIGTVVSVNNNYFTLKTDKELHPQDGIYFNGEGCLINKIDNNKIYPNKKINISIGDLVYRNLDVVFEKELLKPVKRQIGVTININKNITITDEDGISITKEFPLGEKAKNPEKMKDTFIKQLSKTGESDFYIQNIDISTDLPFLSISSINDFRRNLLEYLMKKRIERYNDNKKTQNTLTHNNYFVNEVDYKANIHNSFAKRFYEKCGVSVKESSFESHKPNRQVVLMRCKHCIKYALNLCKTPQNLFLQDEHGNKYPLKFDCKNCEMHVLSN